MLSSLHLVAITRALRSEEILLRYNSSVKRLSRTQMDDASEKRGREDESSRNTISVSRQRLDNDNETPQFRDTSQRAQPSGDQDESLLSSDSDVNKSKKNAAAERDERRLEINRLRAKDMRKRKKKMIEDMQQQILSLTAENNKFRIECQIQSAELAFWRNNNPSMQQQVSASYFLVLCSYKGDIRYDDHCSVLMFPSGTLALF